MRYLLFAAVSFMSCAVNAASLTWTVNEALLNNGGVVSGSFDLDATSGAVSNVSIVSTAYGDAFTFDDLTVFAGGYSEPSCGEPHCYATVYFVANDGADTVRDFGFYLDAPLTGSGGTIGINTIYDVLVVDGNWENEVNQQNPTSASLSAVPLPAPGLLLGSALLVAASRRRETT